MTRKGQSTNTTVHRVTAADDTPQTKKRPKAKNQPTPKTTKRTNQRRLNPLAAIGDYFRGAWAELKLVRWPNRAATWSMTLAVLVFTLIFAIIVLLLDAGFNWAFEQILK